jgi:hypothetical protein
MNEIATATHYSVPAGEISKREFDEAMKISEKVVGKSCAMHVDENTIHVFFTYTDKYYMGAMELPLDQFDGVRITHVIHRFYIERPKRAADVAPGVAAGTDEKAS